MEENENNAFYLQTSARKEDLLSRSFWWEFEMTQHRCELKEWHKIDVNSEWLEIDSNLKLLEWNRSLCIIIIEDGKGDNYQRYEQ